MTQQRIHPLWDQFVARQDEWIGGILEETVDGFPPLADYQNGLPARTKIVGIELRPNGPDASFFEIIGDKFSCGFSTTVGGIDCSPGQEEGWLGFRGYGGHAFRIRKPDDKEP